MEYGPCVRSADAHGMRSMCTVCGCSWNTVYVYGLRMLMEYGPWVRSTDAQEYGPWVRSADAQEYGPCVRSADAHGMTEFMKENNICLFIVA